jgi:hypothetical protein
MRKIHLRHVSGSDLRNEGCIHLQVVRSEMMPPNNGPSRLAIANTELITPE